MKTIVTQAIITGFTTAVDKSLRFRGVTPELNDKDAVALMSIRGINLRLLLEPIDFENDGKHEVKGILDQKPFSQRLRAVLFVLHRQLVTKGKIESNNFDLWYSEQMNRLIEDFKSQLDEEP